MVEKYRSSGVFTSGSIRRLKMVRNLYTNFLKICPASVEIKTSFNFIRAFIRRCYRRRGIEGKMWIQLISVYRCAVWLESRMLYDTLVSVVYSLLIRVGLMSKSALFIATLDKYNAPIKAYNRLGLACLALCRLARAHAGRNRFVYLPIYTDNLLITYQ